MMMKIDLVYLWVDGTDPKWIEKKNRYLPKDKQLDIEVVGDCRFVEHDELKYSLRSVEKFAPWINHIYIVTDSQVPSWIETSSKRITIVDHRDIVPYEYLPLFNSAVLELFIYKIKGLSEHFLYANDDMLFGRAVEPSFFFHADGEPKVRLMKRKLKGRTGNYPRKIYRMQCEAEKRYGKHFKLAPHHNIDAYRKGDYEDTISEFSEDVTRSLQSRFRQDGDLQRSIVSYRLLSHSSKKAIKICRYNGAKSILDIAIRFFSKQYITDSRCFPIGLEHLEEKVARYNPALFTFNDESKASDHDRDVAIDILKKLLPDRSQFEL